MILAQTGQSWPDAAIAIAGIAMVAIIAFVVVWQVFATARARTSVAREEAYRKLAEDATAANRATGEALERATSELADLDRRTAEIERLLKEVQ